MNELVKQQWLIPFLPLVAAAVQSLRVVTTIKRSYVFVVFGVLLFVMWLCPVSSNGGVTILTDMECGKMVERVEWLKEDQFVRLVLKEHIPNHWWIFTARGVKGRTLTFEVVGQRRIHRYYPWKNVQPVMAESADLSNPRLYDEAGFQKQSGNLPWRRIEKAVFDAKTNKLTMEVTFLTDEATIALKFPCPPSYVEKRLAELDDRARRGDLSVLEAGRTARNRPLRLISVPAMNAQTIARWKEKPTFLLYAGEHSTEHDAPHVVMGALEWLLSEEEEAAQFRERYNVLLIPHLSPDDMEDSVFARITDGFTGSLYGYGAENVLWANYWTSYMEQGWRLDVVVDFHNVAGSDAANFFSPAVQVSKMENRCFAKALHEAVMKRMTDAKLCVDGRMMHEGMWSSRLFGWLEASFGVAAGEYEVNSQWPRNRLSLTQLRHIGVDTLRACGDFAAQPKLFEDQRARQQQRWERRRQRMQEVLRTAHIETNNVPEWVTFNKCW